MNTISARTNHKTYPVHLTKIHNYRHDQVRITLEGISQKMKRFQNLAHVAIRLQDKNKMSLLIVVSYRFAENVDGKHDFNEENCATNTILTELLL